MKVKAKISLKNKDRERLLEIASKGKERARTITRCRILLMADVGQPFGEIAKALSIDPNTVRNVSRRYMKEGISGALYDKPRSGAPTIFNGKTRAKLTALACSTAPDGRGQWTLRLLADKAVELAYVEDISHTRVRRILKKTKLGRT